MGHGGGRGGDKVNDSLDSLEQPAVGEWLIVQVAQDTPPDVCWILVEHDII